MLAPTSPAGLPGGGCHSFCVLKPPATWSYLGLSRATGTVGATCSCLQPPGNAPTPAPSGLSSCIRLSVWTQITEHSLGLMK